MAKKVDAYIKLQVPAGQANPSPPVGPALGQAGVNIMEFCKAFNAQTQGVEAGLPIPCVITVYQDRSFTFVTKTPPAAVLLLKELGLPKGSATPNTVKVGTASREQLEAVATQKMPDLNTDELDAAVRIVAGSARSMGIDTEEGGSPMTRQSKRVREFRSQVNRDVALEIDAAFEAVKTHAGAKFSESVDVSVNLGVDPRKSDQVVRGSTVLPNGTGKTTRVAVFAQGAAAEAAAAAGADIVGMDDLAEQVKAGNLNFDVVVAAPDAMRVVGQLGKILGPRGLMPNPKVGTVTPDVADAVSKAKAGQVQYRTDRGGVIHCTLGKVDFPVPALRENLEALVADLQKAKPSAAKGVYLKKITVSSTMGPGIQVERATLA